MQTMAFNSRLKNSRSRELFNTIDFQMVLVADESKVSAKGHDEILDVLNDALFYNSFVRHLFFRVPQSLLH